jgi:hypothetical protein
MTSRSREDVATPRASPLSKPISHRHERGEPRRGAQDTWSDRRGPIQESREERHQPKQRWKKSEHKNPEYDSQPLVALPILLVVVGLHCRLIVSLVWCDDGREPRTIVTYSQCGHTEPGSGDLAHRTGTGDFAKRTQFGRPPFQIVKEPRRRANITPDSLEMQFQFSVGSIPLAKHVATSTTSCIRRCSKTGRLVIATG